jgi:hypothetical protein
VVIAFTQNHQSFYETEPQTFSFEWNLPQDIVQLLVTPQELRDSPIKIRVKDQYIASADVVLGKAVLDCEEIVNGNGKVVTIRGEIVDEQRQKIGEYLIEGREGSAGDASTD